MAGEIEYCLDHLPEDTDLAIVEGQGALNNMFYSGVTLGLLHGCMPDFLIMTHEPGRKIDAAGHSISNLKNLMDMHIDLLRPFKETKFLGLNLNTNATMFNEKMINLLLSSDLETLVLSCVIK